MPLLLPKPQDEIARPIVYYLSEAEVDSLNLGQLRLLGMTLGLENIRRFEAYELSRLIKGVINSNGPVRILNNCPDSRQDRPPRSTPNDTGNSGGLGISTSSRTEPIGMPQEGQQTNSTIDAISSPTLPDTARDKEHLLTSSENGMDLECLASFHRFVYERHPGVLRDFQSGCQGSAYGKRGREPLVDLSDKDSDAVSTPYDGIG